MLHGGGPLRLIPVYTRQHGQVLHGTKALIYAFGRMMVAKRQAVTNPRTSATNDQGKSSPRRMFHYI